MNQEENQSYREMEQIHVSIPKPNLTLIRKLSDKKGIKVQSLINILISEEIKTSQANGII